MLEPCKKIFYINNKNKKIDHAKEISLKFSVDQLDNLGVFYHFDLDVDKVVVNKNS